ncbi:hypothetical protein MP477_12775 [Chryseobacterium sp. WG23]|uniref:hypothetical protein n=1 Tax=Chryseobacterium sp. WG23 TaxID=2926910 RepID=UPI00211DAE8A|nr:hypothetical protein [Chryseobacterium sp. WG23]MCQ9635825.1 hypothetical protein [Chryseobacterium sp. WG23]
MKASILYGSYDILGNALVVRINNLESTVYTLGGYLVGFTKNNIDYYHFLKADFKADDNNKASAGYYSLQDWLKYWADELELNKIRKFEDKTSFEYVQEGDTIIVEKQKIDSSMANYNITETYSYTWNSKERLIPFTNEIYIPKNTIPSTQIYTSESLATNFFNNSKSLINLVTGAENKKKVTQFLVYSAFCLNHISKSILPLFSDATYQSYINEQRNYWTNPFVNASNQSEVEIINLVDSFYQEVVNFYAVGFRCKVKIEKAQGNKKFFYLTLFMGVKALTTLTSPLKIQVLLSAKEELEVFFEQEAVENLIVRITKSFDINTVDRIDAFFEGLLSSNNQSVDSGKTKTLYQYIYDKMSTSLLFTKGVITLSNWVMSTNFTPTDTKGQFVQTIYLLWQFSKYCPYNEDGSIKPNVLGFNKVATEVVTFDNNIQGIFKYTHNCAYTAKIDVENSNSERTFYKYSILNENSAPIVMPYTSEKYVNVFFDNFKFEFQKDKILAKELLITYGKQVTSMIGTSSGPIGTEVLYGKYDILQPVTLLNSDVDSAVPVYSTQGQIFDVSGKKINSFIPLFVLLYIAETNERNNSETLIGYALDVPLTITGVGGLTKLRHLRWAAAGADTIGLVSLQGLSLVIDGLTFTSQVLTYISLIVGDCNNQDEFCKTFKIFSDRLNIVCLSLNGGRMAGIGMTSLTRQASRVISKVAAGATDETIIRANLRAKLILMNATATAETVDKTVDNIYNLYVRSNNLYTNPLGPALSLTFVTYKFAKLIFDKIVNVLIKQQNNLYNISDTIPIGGVVKYPPRFSIYKYEELATGGWKKLSQTVHTEAEICEIIRIGKQYGFSDELTTHFLLKSLRVQKNKTWVQVTGFMERYENFRTTRNFVPYSFTSAIHLESFNNHLRSILTKYGLEKYLDEYQISGSSLYQNQVPDLDLCSYIKKSKFWDAYAESAELFYKNMGRANGPNALKKQDILYAYFKKYVEARKEFAKTNPNITPRQIVENLENLDQLSAKGIIRIENGKIISLADELYDMKFLSEDIKPKLYKPDKVDNWGGIDFNIFINANNGRRLNPDLTIKIN